ncbi:MAG: ABC transporter permease subunit [Clostridia bacterium]|nr:ABC transporter permease subunit [Clostridia bacterium]
MIRSIIQNRIAKKIATVILVAVFWVAVWQILYLAVDKEILLVSPITVLTRLCVLVKLPSFWKTVVFTLIRILIGFSLGVIVGGLLGTVTAKVKFLHTLFRPLITIIKATPVASFIILLLVWTKDSTIPVIISFLMVLPIIWSNVFNAIGQVDNKLLQMADVFELSLAKRFKYIYFPSVMPYFMSASVTALGLSWKAGIAAEVLCQPDNSIGGMLQDAKIYLETPDLFAWTITVIIISMILEWLLIFFVNKLKKRRGVNI